MARAAPDAAALVWLSGTRSFAELDARQQRLAGALASGGIREGDRVAVLSSNRPEFLEVTIGALRTGVVPVPISPTASEAEARYLMEVTDARWVFSDRALEPEPPLDRVVTFGDAYERLLHDADPADLPGWTLGRPLHFTSGSTGRPKGVWVPPAEERTAASDSDRFRAEWDLRAGDVHLVCSPLTHSAPHRFATRTLEAGGAVVLLPKFDPAEVMGAIELFGVTTTFMVPTHLERIFSMSRAARRRHDLSSLRLLAHAGAPIRAETKRAAIAQFPEGSVWEFYGATEGQATRISSQEWLRKPGSVGTPRAGAEIEVRDGSGVRVDPGDVGQVWISDPTAPRFEYWRDPHATARAWRAGFFTVGDLGRVDADGYLFLAGRVGNVIITGGVNVLAEEVEAVLVQHPAVSEAVVYGIPDDEWGQRVEARVVPAFGQPLDVEMLRLWARERLGGAKAPKHIEIVAALPRTASGKLARPR